MNSRLYDFLMIPADWFGMHARRKWAASLKAKKVLEIGAGTGLNMAHYNQDSFFEHTFFRLIFGGMGSSKTRAHPPEHQIALSGTKLRTFLREGVKPPSEFSRPEVAQILISAFHDFPKIQSAFICRSEAILAVPRCGLGFQPRLRPAQARSNSTRTAAGGKPRPGPSRS
jgi:hypothetical protein